MLNPQRQKKAPGQAYKIDMMRTMDKTSLGEAVPYGLDFSAAPRPRIEQKDRMYYYMPKPAIQPLLANKGDVRLADATGAMPAPVIPAPRQLSQISAATFDIPSEEDRRRVLGLPNLVQHQRFYNVHSQWT